MRGYMRGQIYAPAALTLEPNAMTVPCAITRRHAGGLGECTHSESHNILLLLSTRMTDFQKTGQ
jgi:hypothetical protein